MGGYTFPGLTCQRPRMGKLPDAPPTYVERIFSKLYWHLETESDLVLVNGRSYDADYLAAVDAYASVYNVEIVSSPRFPFPSVCHIALADDQ